MDNNHYNHDQATPRKVRPKTNPGFSFSGPSTERVVHANLKQRHVQMIAISGTVGTGLFLGSGGTLASAGPLGALIAYCLVGTVAYASLCSVGEMTTWAPISGTFPHFASRWVDPALGFATGWNYFLTNVLSTPSEISAAVILIAFWDHNLNHAALYTAALVTLLCIINLVGVRYFGESEFIFGMIKIVLMIVLIITGLIIDLGGGANGGKIIGFTYWKNPGSVAGLGLEPKHVGLDRFLAILSVIVQAAFAYQSMELVVIAASETESPRRNIRKAMRRAFYRILIFYILNILVIGMIVPYNNTDLLSLHALGVGLILAPGERSQAISPFVIAINQAGIKVLPHIINASILVSAFSAGSSYLFTASRVLYGLAVRNQAPKFLADCTENGLPLYAVLAASFFALISFMGVSKGSDRVFGWLVNLSTTGGFIGWFVMNVTYIFFRRGLLAQGYDPTENEYYNRFQPFLAYWGAGWTLFFLLINGLTVFWNFNARDFVIAYVNMAIFVVTYIGYKVINKTDIWHPLDMDFVTEIPTREITETPEKKPENLRDRFIEMI